MRALLAALLPVSVCGCDRGAPRMGAKLRVKAIAHRSPRTEAGAGDGTVQAAASEASAAPVGNVAGSGDANRRETTISTAPADPTRLSALREEARAPGFELVTQPRRFEFPRDHGPHPQFRLRVVVRHRSPRHGEWRAVRLRGSPSSVSDSSLPRHSPPSANASAWRASQIYMAHFAVTDIERETFHVAERFARDALGLAGASAELSGCRWKTGRSAPRHPRRHGAWSRRTRGTPRSGNRRRLADHAQWRCGPQSQVERVGRGQLLLPIPRMSGPRPVDARWQSAGRERRGLARS